MNPDEWPLARFLARHPDAEPWVILALILAVYLVGAVLDGVAP